MSKKIGEGQNKHFSNVRGGRNLVRSDTFEESDIYNNTLIETEGSERVANALTYYRDFSTADFEEETFFFKDSDVVNQDLNKR